MSRRRGRILKIAGETPLSKEEEAEKIKNTKEWNEKIDKLIQESRKLVESSQEKNEEFKKKIDEWIQESEKFVESTQEKNEEFEKKIHELELESEKLAEPTQKKIEEFEKKIHELKRERITKNIAFDKLSDEKLANFGQNIDKLNKKKYKTQEWHNDIYWLIKDSAELAESTQEKIKEFEKKFSELTQESEKLAESSQEKIKEFEKKISELVQESAELAESTQKEIKEFEKKFSELTQEGVITFDKLEIMKLVKFGQNINNLKDEKEKIDKKKQNWMRGNLTLNYPEDTEDDGITNQPERIQTGPFRGRKDHTKNSPCGEDCFLINMTEIRMLNRYNPIVYNEFGYLSSGAARIRDRLRKYNKEIKKKMPEYFSDKEDVCADEYLDKNIYKKRIDEWIEKVKLSKVPAAKIIIVSHSDEERILSQLTKDSRRWMSKKGEYLGQEETLSKEAIECLEYLFERLKEVDKNVDVGIVSCCQGIYLDDKKNASIMSLIEETAKEIVKKDKNFIVTNNYSPEYEQMLSNTKRLGSSSVHQYQYYNKEKQCFIPLCPRLQKEDSNAFNLYNQYNNFLKQEVDKLIPELKGQSGKSQTQTKNSDLKQTKTVYDRVKEINFRQAMAYIKYIVSKLKEFGDTTKEKEEKQWAENKIKEIRSCVEECKQGFAVGMMKCMKKINKKILDLKNKKFYEYDKDEKIYKKFAEKYPLCFRDDGIMPNGVRKIHRRHRSYELFFDNNTVKEIKEAKKKKDKMLFGERIKQNEIKEEDKKEEEKKNEIKTETNVNLTDQDKNKKQNNEINGH